MSRDWDKLRRQDKARAAKIYDFEHKFQKKKPHFRRRVARKPAVVAAPTKKPAPKATFKVLAIESPGWGTAFACFERRPNWRCVWAQDPYEWFTRVRHPEIIRTWLLKEKLSFRWITNPPAAIADKYKAAADHPAEAYPPIQASDPKGVNTVPALQIHPRATALPDAQQLRPGWSGMALITSSPLNASGVSQSNENTLP